MSDCVPAKLSPPSRDAGELLYGYSVLSCILKYFEEMSTTIVTMPGRISKEMYLNHLPDVMPRVRPQMASEKASIRHPTEIVIAADTLF